MQSNGGRCSEASTNLRSVFKCSSFEVSSGPWGFDFLHAYTSWETMLASYGLAMYLNVGFESLKLKVCELKLWELTVNLNLDPEDTCRWLALSWMKHTLPSLRALHKGGGRVLLTETLLPRISRQGTVCLISIRGYAREARVEKFELDEGFQPHHPPFRLQLHCAPSATSTTGKTVSVFLFFWPSRLRWWLTAKDGYWSVANRSREKVLTPVSSPSHRVEAVARRND